VAEKGAPTQGATATQDKDKTSLSMQSQLTSSLLETSDEKLSKKKKKDLTEKEQEAIVDIELGETETFDLLFIPSILVPNDTPEHT
jgi:hypothetical protein